jgi:hypothetical protein
MEILKFQKWLVRAMDLPVVVEANGDRTLAIGEKTRVEVYESIKVDDRTTFFIF